MRSRVSMTVVVALALLAAGTGPAWAAAPFTVTAADGTRFGATRDELDHWAEIARRAGTPRNQARPLAFDLLVGLAWIRGEAADRGLSVTHEQVVGKFRRQRDDTFSTRRAYRRFLRESGQKVGDLLLRVRVDTLSERIRRQVTAPAEASVTDAVIDAYLAEHGPPRVPERRDLRIVLTRRRGEAVAAKRELLEGASWRAVARRYSIDEASREAGARLPDVVRGTLERRLDRAVFGARLRRVVGPVRTQFGYYVFRVTRVHPARDLPEAEARQNARAILVSEAQQAALGRFIAEFDAKWQTRTVCAPAWRSHPRCGGYGRLRGAR